MKAKANDMTKQEHASQLEAANRRGLEAQVGQVHALSARFDRERGELALFLRGGLTLLVPVHLLQGVAEASPENIEEVAVVAGGFALRFESLDADFSVQDLASGSFGTRAWMEHLEETGALDEASIARRRMVDELLGAPNTAAQMGRKGGAARTPQKSAASRANGIKGGRPRKAVAGN